MPQGQGRGIAQHTCFGTYVAATADISVNENDGKIKVHKITLAIDCGPVVSPDPLVAQAEGCAREASPPRSEDSDGALKNKGA